MAVRVPKSLPREQRARSGSLDHQDDKDVSGSDGEDDATMEDQPVSDDDASSSSGQEAEDEDPSQSILRHTSFASLSKAQESLPKVDRKRKRGEEASSEHKASLAAMRERLQELRERKDATEATMRGLKTEDKNKGKGKDTSSKQDAFFTNGNGVDDTASDSDGSDSGSDEEGEDGAKKPYKRSSKHAPTALPANRAVGRHRDVVDVPKNRSRDPRFDVTSGQLDRNSLGTRYSFINDYQSSELTQLKKALKDPKARLNDEQRDKLQRKMISLESKLSHNKAREREEKVRQEHKKKEREAVAQGKNPFYLKKSDVKKQALTERFEGMKSRQKDKVIQRRRKKLVAKERKNMPLDRRV